MMRSMLRLTLATFAAFLLASIVLAVDRNKFHTCKKSPFCDRNRNKSSSSAEYYIAEELVLDDDGTGSHAKIASHLRPDDAPLELRIRAYSQGIARIRIVESDLLDLPPRYESVDMFADGFESTVEKLNVISKPGHFEVRSSSGRVNLKVFSDPFIIDILNDEGNVISKFNGHGYFNFEQRQLSTLDDASSKESVTKDLPEVDESRKVIDWGEDGKPIYDDSESHDTEDLQVEVTDEKDENSDSGEEKNENDRTSVSFDLSFVGIKHLYGLPEHATSFSLKNTRGASSTGESYDEPFRMYNLDVFEYEMDEPMALYGHVPAVIAHSAGHTMGAFWNNPSELFVDIDDDVSLNGRRMHWISESGIVDLFLSVGPRPTDVFSQYASITGTTATPPMFSLGYHQCRWNYNDEKDVENVNAGFEEHDVPYDVIWLDIEHTNGKRYFTWDDEKFPNPVEMQRNIEHYGRKMVTIVDPHVKRDKNYGVHQQAEGRGYYVKDKDGEKDFSGWCWPGDSSYPDFTSSLVREWWSSLFSYDHYVGSTPILYTWNDMNEPSVFNGPEVSMPRDALSLDGVKHSEWHNLYGFYFHMASSQGLIQRSPDGKMRPFVLSRAFYAGSQRFGAIWTGDNAAEWAHLKASSNMLLSLSVAGIAFGGADVGGFFGNPDTELLERWYQAAAFQPFFRGHAHIESKRREVWLFGEEVLRRIRKTIRMRYSFLSYWYTVFYEHETRGLPPMRPLWSLAPSDEKTFEIGDQWLVGHDLLVKPVTDAGTESIEVYLPAGFGWYRVEEAHAYHAGGQKIEEKASLEQIPLYQRAGSIIPRRMRPRRSTYSMRNDPFTLFVAAEKGTGNAEGSLYLDDEMTFNYQEGEHCIVNMVFSSWNNLSATSVCGGNYKEDIEVEKIVVMGLSNKPKTIHLGTDSVVKFEYNDEHGTLVIRKPSDRFFEVPFTAKISYE